MDLWHWYAFLPHTRAALDGPRRGGRLRVAHAIGNLVLAAAGPSCGASSTATGEDTRTEVVWASTAIAAAVALASRRRRSDAAQYLEPAGGERLADEPAPSHARLTAWAALGLRVGTLGRGASSRRVLAVAEADLHTATDLELSLVARAALGDPAARATARPRARRLGPHRPDAELNDVGRARADGGRRCRAWRIDLAPAASAARLRRVGVDGGRCARLQRHGGGGSGASRRGRRRPADRRALPFLLGHQRKDGGFELSHGRGSDVQSTAWAVQAFVAAGRRRPRGRAPSSACSATTEAFATPPARGDAGG